MKRRYSRSLSPSFFLPASLAVIGAFCFASCGGGGGGGGGPDGNPSTVYPIDFAFTGESTDGVYSGPSSLVTKVEFGADSSKIVTFTGLTGQNVLLVKVNPSASTVSGGGTGGVASSALASSGGTIDLGTETVRETGLPVSRVALGVAPSSRAISGSWDGVTRYDYTPATDFNANPTANISSAARGATLPGGLTPDKFDPDGTVGSSDSFNVQNAAGSWIQVSMTCCADNAYCQVWVDESVFDNTPGTSVDNKISQANVDTLAGKFLAIYPLETAALGYQYGYGSGKKIKILVYDIGFDYATTRTTNSGVFGYFWAKDYYDYSGCPSNKGDIIYIDSYFTDRAPDQMYSTLIHEFQHMINFNRKEIMNDNNVDTWYNEMLSLVAEDMIGPELSLPVDSHPKNTRIPTFLAYYDSDGLTDWHSTLANYAIAYGFGAYLARNYGGPALISAIEANTSANVDSIGAALKTYASAAFPSSLTSEAAFAEAARRYGQALVYSGINVGTYAGAGLATFHKPASGSVGGTTYSFSAFDIWTKHPFDYSTGTSYASYGPLVWPLAQYDIPAYCSTLQSAASWQNVTGDLSITLERPSDSNVELYLMIR